MSALSRFDAAATDAAATPADLEPEQRRRVEAARQLALRSGVGVAARLSASGSVSLELTHAVSTGEVRWDGR